MASNLSVSEFDLLNFFGVMPSHSDEDLPWMYYDSAYEVNDGHSQVTFALAPMFREVRLILRSGTRLLYELHATDVEDIKCHNDNGRKTLEVIVSSHQSIWLRINPVISIIQSITNSDNPQRDCGQRTN